MNTCDICKHWNQNPIYPNRHIKYENSGTCGNPKLDSEPSEKGNQDCAQGGEPADWTGITTGPKFGCIHFQTLLIDQSVVKESLTTPTSAALQGIDKAEKSDDGNLPTVSAKPISSHVAIVKAAREEVIEAFGDMMADIGIYPASIVDPSGGGYEKRNDYQNGWNAALQTVVKNWCESKNQLLNNVDDSDPCRQAKEVK